MTAKIIDGQAIAKQMQEEIAEKVAARVAAGKPVPGLATVLVGEDPASSMYVHEAEALRQGWNQILPCALACRYLPGRPGSQSGRAERTPGS